jgi:uncharacterized protein YdiU (UPF0061 family)
MHANAADFTLTFRRLCDALATDTGASEGARTLFADPFAFDAWETHWHQRLRLDGVAPQARAQAMRACNPARIARNHRVEQAIRAAVDAQDIDPAIALVQALSRPHDDDPSLAPFTLPAHAGERVTRTFCGT